ncbi:hypothetical protein P7K49_036503 [Saguinus oedipus]|uniref:Uncharacterized protein n=1 Tax=Saguinus oedipus TaxID=9490 RepID=A0ABQ9TKA2_SAGOE|nr:hypothetical protein P7K49_036503 [Saguinus oedipus]
MDLTVPTNFSSNPVTDDNSHKSSSSEGELGDCPVDSHQDHSSGDIRDKHVRKEDSCVNIINSEALDGAHETSGDVGSYPFPGKASLVTSNMTSEQTTEHHSTAWADLLGKSWIHFEP